MASSSPSVVPQRSTPYTYNPPTSPQISTRPRLPFSVQSPVPPGATPATPGATVPIFKAPAHKHAHHLHSIPPREKSTRTLILDHLLWVHARTRLQQARAELGMAVSKDAVVEAGESPKADETEKEPEEPEEISDGEEIISIKFGAKEHERNERSQAEDDYEQMQNLPLAHALRLRADGVEKVLIAMLDQPPEVQPPYSDEDAPRTPPAIHGEGEHHFPNGVRLRLALSTLVNDLFARDTPTPLSPRTSNTPAFQARNAQTTPSGTPRIGPLSSVPKSSPGTIQLPPSSLGGKYNRPDDELLDNGLPVCVASLAPIASFSLHPDRSTDQSVGGATSLPSISTFTTANANPTTDTLPPILNAVSSSQSQSTKPRRASGRVLTLYEAGADPSTANSPPSLRCPRHLHHTCQICAPAKAPSMTAGSGGPPMYTSGASPKSPSQTRGAIVLGSGGKSKLPGMGAIAPNLAPWKTGPGIGAGLAKPGVEGTVLRRRTISHHTTSHPTAKDAGPCSSGGKLVDLIPRFIRLSALVAVELGREAKDKEEDAVKSADSSKQSNPRSDVSSTGRDSDDEDEPMTGSSGGQTPRTSVLKSATLTSPYLLSLSFRPTKDWYAMLAGLLTRAVVEGYLSRGWKGPQGMECLLGVGLGMGPNLSKDIEDEFAHLDPDDCPSLVDAAKILFPTLCKQLPYSWQRREKLADSPEAVYEVEMLERTAEFLTVPATTPDLSTHLEDLAYKFPAEPIERAVVRFCEAIASWRGLPELENYKQKNGPLGAAKAAARTSTTQTSIDSLVQSASGTLQSVASLPRAPKASIERYFVAPPPPPPPSAKRRRSNTTTSAKGDQRSKKTHFETDEWTGPYGI